MIRHVKPWSENVSPWQLLAVALKSMFFSGVNAISCDFKQSIQLTVIGEILWHIHQYSEHFKTKPQPSLVGGIITPLKDISVSGVGWWHFQYIWKKYVPVTTNQCIYIYIHTYIYIYIYPYIFHIFSMYYQYVGMIFPPTNQVILIHFLWKQTNLHQESDRPAHLKVIIQSLVHHSTWINTEHPTTWSTRSASCWQ